MPLSKVSVETLTSSCPTHVVESDSEVKHVVTSVCYQSDVDHTTLSDGVVLRIKLHFNICKQINTSINYHSIFLLVQ